MLDVIELLSGNAVKACRPFSHNAFDRFWRFISTRGPYDRYDIRSNVPYGPDGRILRFLRSVANEYPIPDTSFIYYQQDCLPCFGLKTRLMSLIYPPIPSLSQRNVWANATKCFFVTGTTIRARQTLKVGMVW
jgi:hypothetical protein